MAKIGSAAVISLPEIKLVSTTLFIMGASSLVVHRFAEKARKQMLDKQMKEARGGRDARTPLKEVDDARYRVDEMWDGFPAVAFKAAAVTACTSLADVTKTAARQAFAIKGIQIEEAGTLDGAICRNALVPIIAPPHTIREDVVRLAGPSRTAELRFRPEYSPWAAALDVTLNQSVLSVDQLATMFEVAGMAVGVGEYRCERDGDLGGFKVIDEAAFNAHRDWCIEQHTKARAKKPALKAAA